MLSAHLPPIQPLLLALDTPNPEAAWQLANRLMQETPLKGFKVGMSVFYQPGGRQLLHRLHEAGAFIMLDLKLHDIPETVHRSVSALMDLPWHLLTLHALGGFDMLMAAQSVLNKAHLYRALLGVTVLTSHSDKTLHNELGINGSVADAVIRLATMVANAGLGGVVCSPHEIAPIRNHLSPPFKLVTPGIRLADSHVQGDDQLRAATPQTAREAGADFLVVGRPILQDSDPVRACQKILDSLSTEASKHA
ncbi:MAG: orotidine-5'-phosphate decarboxylase [Vampirovibrionales bacterium]|nr:orotidine-5'-phosphate decarboxylase [Vampirovibrionales bacterium]